MILRRNKKTVIHLSLSHIIWTFVLLTDRWRHASQQWDTALLQARLMDQGHLTSSKVNTCMSELQQGRIHIKNFLLFISKGDNFWDILFATLNFIWRWVLSKRKESVTQRLNFFLFFCRPLLARGAKSYLTE